MSAPDPKEVANCVEAKRLLNGLPPHDTMANHCWNDGHYSAWINRTFSTPVLLAADAIIEEEQRKWQQARNAFLRQRG